MGQNQLPIDETILAVSPVFKHLTQGILLIFSYQSKVDFGPPSINLKHYRTYEKLAMQFPLIQLLLSIIKINIFVNGPIGFSENSGSGSLQENSRMVIKG